ncbi:mycofactocin-coupled SDR family oxidoreductase [Sporichthya brevicatena]|uniref:Mycofactocin-coupled SDR family oxidoreductase n=1 Tax=Sporichthya brevicatena TaxID=171442 RepID=A0ABP3RUY5_9ACTN
MSGRLAGKVAFITGAARGQGRSHAVKLAQEGADIIALDLCEDIDVAPYPLATPDDLAETVRLVEAADRRIVAAQADVRDLDALTAAVDAGVAELGRLDIVLGNAGIAQYAPMTELTAHQWSTMIDVNLTGVFHTVKASLPHLLAHGEGGSIVLTSSAAGLRGIENCAHYCAAKHGLVGMMKGLALELGRHRIRVNTVHPTTVNTDMVQNPATYDLFLPGKENPTQEQFARIAQHLNVLPEPWAEPADVSAAIAFLCSDEARLVTGVSFPVDAGMAVRW